MSPKQRPTLPPIRDIFGAELSNSLTVAPFSLAPLEAALSDDSGVPSRVQSDRSPSFSPALPSITIMGSTTTDRLGLRRHSATDSDLSTPTTSQPSTASSFSMSTPPPAFRSFSPLPNSRSSRRSSTASLSSSVQSCFGTEPLQRSKSYSFSAVGKSHRDKPPGCMAAWEDYSSVIAFEERMGYRRPQPTPATNPRQVRPYAVPVYVPVSQALAGRSRFYKDTPPPEADFTLPAVLLAPDDSMTGVPPADPQRIAMLGIQRTSYSPLSSGFEQSQTNTSRQIPSTKYQCSYCVKRFNRPSSLKIHLNTHTGEKPFQCPHPGCGRCFSVQSNMRRHARIHEQGSQSAHESSDDVSEAGSERSTTSPAPILQALSVDTRNPDVGSRSEDSLGAETTPVARAPSHRQSQDSQPVPRGRRPDAKHRTQLRISRSKSPSSDEKMRPGKRSRRSSLGSIHT